MLGGLPTRLQKKMSKRIAFVESECFPMIIMSVLASTVSLSLLSKSEAQFLSSCQVCARISYDNLKLRVWKNERKEARMACFPA